MPIIVLSNHYSDGPLSIIYEVLPPGFELVNLSKATGEELLKAVPQADYILASGRVKIGKEVIESSPKLKMIQRTGVGLDSIDLDVLEEKQIPLYVNTGINSDSVAEHAILLILAALRRLTTIDAQVKSGVWIKQGNGIKNRELKGKTVGIIGMGHIGRKVARILSAFEARIVYTDVCRTPEDFEKKYDITYMQLADLLAESDVVTLHCPLTEENRNLFDRKAFEGMKRDAIIVNTARGGLIEEQSLVYALEQNIIAGAALDVFASEPLTKDSPLLKFDNVILTPHIGGVTYDSFKAMMKGAMYNIDSFHNGRLGEIEDRKYNLKKQL